MATLTPFRAVRPAYDAASRVAAVPYDVVDTGEALALSAGNPLSFLHVSRAEIDLPDTVDAHDAMVYRAADERYRWLKQEAPLTQEKQRSLYIYRLEADGHGQTGVAGCFSLDEYDSGVVKKHERTRKDKEDDRTRHIVSLRAQTGPVFLTYRSSARIDEIARRVRGSRKPVANFTALDGVHHSVWRAGHDDARGLIEAFAEVRTLYIADGHHRAASAARARQEVPNSREAALFLAVAFPSDQVRILPYNRVVRDLNGMTAERFLGEVAKRFPMIPGRAVPEEKGHVSMFVDGRWFDVDIESAGIVGEKTIGRLDAQRLQDQLLEPLLDIKDVTTDTRIDFVGGARGTRALEQLVDTGRMAVAFSMYPVSVVDLMAVSDADEIMPPKSTWFEPKLRDGLLIHEI